MSVFGAKRDPQPRITARARLRPKGQLTLPEAIRRALHVGEGDEVEFVIHEDGTVMVKGYVSVPSDQAWRYTRVRPTDERQADDEITVGRN